MEKIISISKPEKLEHILKKETGKIGMIVILPEGSFENHETEHLINLSQKYNATLIGTLKDEEYGFQKAVIVRRDGTQDAQYNYPVDYGDHTIEEIRKKESLFKEQDKVYDVSPHEEEVKALIRICADYVVPTEVKEKIDLLIIPSSIDHSDNFNISQFERISKENTLIIYSIKDNISGGIFDINLNRVGETKKGYHVCKLNQ